MWKKEEKWSFFPSALEEWLLQMVSSLTFPVCICLFYEVAGKREVCGGNWPVNLYNTWREFHPFLYTGYFQRYQTDQFEHFYFMSPYSSSWTQVFFLKRSVAKTSSIPPLSEVRFNTMSQAQAYQKDVFNAFQLAQSFFRCDTMKLMTKELWFIAPFPTSTHFPFFCPKHTDINKHHIK